MTDSALGSSTRHKGGAVSVVPPRRLLLTRQGTATTRPTLNVAVDLSDRGHVTSTDRGTADDGAKGSSHTVSSLSRVESAASPERSGAAFAAEPRGSNDGAACTLASLGPLATTPSATGRERSDTPRSYASEDSVRADYATSTRRVLREHYESTMRAL